MQEPDHELITTIRDQLKSDEESAGHLTSAS